LGVKDQAVLNKKLRPQDGVRPPGYEACEREQEDEGLPAAGRNGLKPRGEPVLISLWVNRLGLLIVIDRRVAQR
jgi:hypothetical protein